ncbi:MAG: c-type cytochrome biogenesis protein CcmI, partial [Alphaproteobacteria bacterium]
MLLWIIFAGLTTIALAAVLWPYLFPRKAEMPSAEEGAFDAAVYRDQLEELEADAARGLISAAEAEAARVEISRRLLAAADQERAKSRSGKEVSSRARARKASPAPTGRLRPAVAVLAAALVLPLLSLSLYLTYGSPALPDQPLAQRLAAAQQEQKIDVLIRKVEERLQKHPED